MRRLEHEDFAVLALERRNAQPDLGFAKQLVAELVGQNSLQRFRDRRYSGRNGSCRAARLSGGRAESGELREDFRSAFDVEVAKFGGRISGAKTEGENAACRGTCNKIEARRD